MPSIVLKFKNFFSTSNGLQKQLSLVFVAMLLAVIFFCGFSIKRSVDLVLNVPEAPVGKKPGVRVDFQGYDAVIDRMEKVKKFTPNIKIERNPFGVK